MFRYIFLLTIFIYPFFGQTLFTFQSEGMNLKLEKIAPVSFVPWGMTFISDDKIIINGKNGKIKILDIKTKELKVLKNTPIVFYEGQGGLLDVQKSNFFKKDSLLYFTYVKKIKGQGVTTLARAKLINNRLEEWKDLFISSSATNTSRHFGSRITFDEEGHIFFSIGDRGVRKNAQNLKNHAGTIIRLNLDGSIPKDNPFINLKNKKEEIYSYGHRNPQGLFYDKTNKKLWSSEHGPRGGDEINLIKKGKNYGWPVISHGKEYWSPIRVGEGTHKEGMIQAKKVYIPSIAPSSLIVYTDNILDKWKGNIFLGALKLRHLNRIVLDSNGGIEKEERLLEELGERIRNVIQSPKGDLIISTDSGNILKLTLDN